MAVKILILKAGYPLHVTLSLLQQMRPFSIE